MADTVKLTSIDYARLVQLAAQKFHMTQLNKTQINKILFLVYGVYLANTGKHLFDDDTPKAWPFGPVFPKVYKKVNTSEVIRGFDKPRNDEFKKKPCVLSLITDAVDAMCGMSAVSLTRWSHQEGSPWYNTIFNIDVDGNVTSQKPWNSSIGDDCIAEYFSNPENCFGVTFSSEGGN